MRYFRKKVLFRSGLLIGSIIILTLLAAILQNAPLKSYPLIFNYKKITPLSPFYFVKTFREFMQSQFIFGDEEQSFWYFRLAEKRIDEAEYLQSFNAAVIAKKQMDSAKKYQSKASTYLNNVKDKVDVNYLIEMEQANKKRLF